MEHFSFTKRRVSPQKDLQAEPEWNLLQPAEQKRIAVVGISRGAGATFAASTLAFLLQQSKFVEEGRKLSVPVTYVQMRQPEAGETMVYFEAGLDQRFGKNMASDWQGSLKVHLHKGINWSVWRHCRKHEEETEHVFRPYPEKLPGQWVIADSPPLDTLGRYNLVVGIIDPLPAAVYAGAETYEILRDMETAGLPVLWVLNRDNREVNHSGLKRFLKLKDWICLPMMNPELVYRAQYTCCLPAELMDGECRTAAELLAEKVAAMAALNF